MFTVARQAMVTNLVSEQAKKWYGRETPNRGHASKRKHGHCFRFYLPAVWHNQGEAAGFLQDCLRSS